MHNPVSHSNCQLLSASAQPSVELRYLFQIFALPVDVWHASVLLNPVWKEDMSTKLKDRHCVCFHYCGLWGLRQLTSYGLSAGEGNQIRMKSENG